MSCRRVLLVEPAYRSKYPPLGLMKISAYHKLLGDKVVFVRGCDPSASARFWDRIYIATMFSFDWKTTVRTIRYYKDNLFGSASKVIVGGISSSIMPHKIYEETGIFPIVGCLNRKGMLGDDNDLVVDALIPDYSILDQVPYRYAYANTYIGYATRGCIRKCPFCAVPTLEPEFIEYIDVKQWVNGIREQHGEKKDLMLLDNNVLASPALENIVRDLLDLGFETGARIDGKARHVDFNQGLDARLLTKQKMRHLARLPIRPFRIAYDHPRMAAIFERAVRIAADMGVRTFFTYLLYNWRDKPTDLWDRIHHAVQLSDELGVHISSFPMKYIPVNATDRSHVGPNWNRRYLRSIQCILNVTKGVVSARHDFFHEAFGRNHEHYLEILAMPDQYIIERAAHKNGQAAKWRRSFRRLGAADRAELLDIVSLRARDRIAARMETLPAGRLKNLLAHYLPEAQ